MSVFWVSKGKPEGELTPEKEKAYSDVNTIFCGAVVGVLIETLQDTYLRYKTAKEMWNTLNTEYRDSYAGTELYIIEQYHDYQMGKVWLHRLMRYSAW
jgi:tryptophan synthase beta subunit